MTPTDTLPPLASPGSFTPEQKEYLAGFMAGVNATGLQPFVGQTGSGQLTATADQATTANLAAPAVAGVFGTPLADLCKEERWKADENPLDAWDRLLQHAEEDRAPGPEDTFRFKFFGLFHVAPAQDSFMLRLRIPACELSAAQLHGIADLASECGGGYADITTRGNLQVREFKPRDLIKVLTRVQDLGLTSRGAGADNIRNITASPDSGFAPDELLDVRPHARALHHYILNHRDLYGLPRKFNVAFDSGSSLSVAADTNDIGFVAVRVGPRSVGACSQAMLPSSNCGSPMADSGLANATSEIRNPESNIEPGVYFRVQLGGITGHQDFARDTGLLIKPSEAVAVAAAMIRVFCEHGCRTDRKKARLKYLLERWGVDKFLAETQRKLAFPLGTLAREACAARRPVEKHGWLGVRRQAQRGFNSLGVGIPAGRMSARQMHGLADLAANFGRGELRLTVWQNLLLPHVSDGFVDTVERTVKRLGFFTAASFATGGIVACTGRRGCKYAGTDTKAHAVALARHLEGRVSPGTAVNLHLTGCPHSCAQHYCGDIGFLGTKLADGSEGYHVFLGGGMDHEQGVARELFRGVRATEINALTERVLGTFETARKPGETFAQWTRRQSVKELQEQLSA